MENRARPGFVCEPRFATARDPARRTYGAPCRAVAARMGLDLLPVQERVLDTALEVDDDGQFVYRTVVFTVPRQGTKTTTTRVLRTWWGLGRERNLIVGTAQSGLDARIKWLDAMEDLEALPWFRSRMAHPPRRANGSEMVKWRTGTRDRPVSPTPKKGHGDTLDLGIIDEAWSFTDESVVTAMRPAMMTRDSQLWIVSTAGTETSVLLRRHVEMGRRAVAAGEQSALAYFEWSAADDAEPDDPETWWSCIPTLGLTVTEARIRDDKATLKPEDFERSYLNRWVDRGVETVIPWGAWLVANSADAAPQDPLWLGCDIAPERDFATITAAGVDVSGTKVAVELLEARGGTEWLAPRIEELRARHDVAGVIIDGTGPAAGLGEDLTEVPDLLPSRELVVACGAFYDAIVAATVVVRPSSVLTTAVRAAVKLGSGDGGFRWGRKRSRGDITALMGATMAYWRARAELDAPSLRIY